MKTHSMEWLHINTHHAANNADPAKSLNAILHLAARAFIAVVPALAIIVAAAWVIAAPSVELYLQAAVWASGFILMALAIDSKKNSKFGLALATGLALPVLAVLSSRVASEFLVVAGVLIASWVAALIWRNA